MSDDKNVKLIALILAIVLTLGGLTVLYHFMQ